MSESMIIMIDAPAWAAASSSTARSPRNCRREDEEENTSVRLSMGGSKGQMGKDGEYAGGRIGRCIYSCMYTGVHACAVYIMVRSLHLLAGEVGVEERLHELALLRQPLPPSPGDEAVGCA
jgi:hypothetical protein